MTIEYRQIEYDLMQGVGGHLWKWSATIADERVKGHAHTKAAAVAAAEKAIDRALAVKKVRLARLSGPTEMRQTIAYCGGFNSPCSQPVLSDFIGSSAMTVSV